MTLSNLLLGLSDLGLLLAVVGVYVFFAALWLIYSVTERSAWGSPRQERRVDRLRRNNLREINEKREVCNESEDDLHRREYVDSIEHVVSVDLDQIRAELVAVREISVENAAQVELLQQEVATLRVEADEHLEFFHAESEETTCLLYTSDAADE